MRIVIVGGGGFIGTNLIIYLNQCGYDTVCCDKYECLYKQQGTVYHTISSDKQYSDILEPGDLVFYLQWNGTSVTSTDTITRTINNNIVPLVCFFDICKQKGVERLIFSSSGGTVYGITGDAPIRESQKLNPISSYGIQKVTAELYISLLSREYDLKSTILRISNPYGPGQRPFAGQGVVATYLACALTNKPFTLRGDGKEIRDYIYIDDLTQALEKIITYEGDEKIFNIGSGNGCSLAELIKIMDSVLISSGKQTAEKLYIPKAPTDVTSNILDCSLIKKATGWQASTDLYSGIEKMLKKWDREKELFNIGE